MKRVLTIMGVLLLATMSDATQLAPAAERARVQLGQDLARSIRCQYTAGRTVHQGTVSASREVSHRQPGLHAAAITTEINWKRKHGPV